MTRCGAFPFKVQMSSEMWDFASPYEAASNQKDHEASCHIYFDKFIAFVRRLFNKWKKLEVRCSKESLLLVSVVCLLICALTDLLHLFVHV